MSYNSSDAAQINGTAAELAEFPYHNAILTLCYLVGWLQIGYYLFYILFMGTDAMFKTSRAFDYDDFECQRKTVQAGGEDFENNANITACVGRNNSGSGSSSESSETETADSDNTGGNGDGSQGGGGTEVAVTGGGGGRRRNLRQSRRWRTLRSAPAAGGLRGGPLHRLMQSCSCMLVYNSDDEDEDEDDDDDSCSERLAGVSATARSVAHGDARATAAGLAGALTPSKAAAAAVATEEAEASSTAATSFSAADDAHGGFRGRASRGLSEDDGLRSPTQPPAAVLIPSVI